VQVQLRPFPHLSMQCNFSLLFAMMNDGGMLIERSLSLIVSSSTETHIEECESSIKSGQLKPQKLSIK
jgi:hypothetical protein